MASEYVQRRLAEIAAEPARHRPASRITVAPPKPPKRKHMKPMGRPTYVGLLAYPGAPIVIRLEGWTTSDVPRFILPLDQLRALPRDEPPDCGGVYFLWRGPQLLYIGLSRYLGERLAQHLWAKIGLRSGKRIPFTHYTYKAMPDSEIENFESDYILAYVPPYNDKIPYSWRSRDAL
jgi:hypothetical protein